VEWHSQSGEAGPQPQALSYAPPLTQLPVPPGHRVWAATMIVVAGLGLLVVGGCFLVGVLTLVINLNDVLAWSPRSTAFMFLLYGLAGACFTCGVLLMINGVRALLAAARGITGAARASTPAADPPPAHVHEQRGAPAAAGSRADAV
jgi:hypothetical protein